MFNDRPNSSQGETELPGTWTDAAQAKSVRGSSYSD